MARTKAVLGSGARLSDYLSASLLARVVPAEVPYCVPMAEPRFHPAAFYRGLRLVAIDGSNFELPDEADNEAYFGRPGSRTGVAGYPQAQCAVLVECATHAILAANLCPYRADE